LFSIQLSLYNVTYSAHYYRPSSILTHIASYITQHANIRCKTQDARRKTQDARRKTQDARRKTQDARRNTTRKRKRKRKQPQLVRLDNDRYGSFILGGPQDGLLPNLPESAHHVDSTRAYGAEPTSQSRHTPPSVPPRSHPANERIFLFRSSLPLLLFFLFGTCYSGYSLQTSLF
jgi:hypothetical protein